MRRLCLLALVFLIVPLAATEHTWLPATAQKLPRWRGFNLLEWFNAGNAQAFREEDFQLISELGFNFVRIPMDYRIWITGGDWEKIDDTKFAQLDQAVKWGEQYGIHVCLNFHRGPGYTVAQPPEAKVLWTDANAQRVCAKHWAFVAKRYRGIPNERLSFDLLNEPAQLEGPVYAHVAKLLVAAIHAEDASRLIISDGLNWGNVPCQELIDAGVAQATRGYVPFEISHYQAPWINGWEKMATPAWPLPRAAGVMGGPGKPAMNSPLRLDGPFAATTKLRLRVGVVSDRGHLVVKGDGTQLWEHEFVCGPGVGEWAEAVYVAAYKIHQNRYDRDYLIDVPPGTQAVTIENIAGDWLTIREIGVTAAGSAEAVAPMTGEWNEPPGVLRVAQAEGSLLLTSSGGRDREWLWRTTILPWKELEGKGVGVMVGEWGAFDKTPHPVTLRWMEDCLINYRKADWGWALWNFRGGFGPLDSQRSDVQYEEWKGHKLDRKMLELLQRY
ncbi:MAG TPA: cellulase family glycosylhydrolase [Planctomycetota bacterium]|nr:cellulase family glycosylhydrolase [Planctomycetota bacterium]